MYILQTLKSQKVKLLCSYISIILSTGKFLLRYLFTFIYKWYVRNISITYYVSSFTSISIKILKIRIIFRTLLVTFIIHILTDGILFVIWRLIRTISIWWFGKSYRQSMMTGSLLTPISFPATRFVSTDSMWLRCSILIIFIATSSGTFSPNSS